MSALTSRSPTVLTNRGALIPDYIIDFIGDRSIRCKLLLLISLTLLWTGAANASPIIFSSGVTTPTNFLLSGDSDQFVGSQFLADDFTFTQPEILTDIHWTGDYTNSSGVATSAGTDAFTIQICTGFPSPVLCGSGPLTLGAVTRTVVGTIGAGGYYDYSVDVTALQINAGTDWIIISNNPTSEEWNWGATSGGDAYQMLNQPGPGTWTQGSENMDFSLTGTSVPEPASLALFSLGIAGLAFSRRKQ